MVELGDIQSAAERIQSVVMRTPLVFSPGLSRVANCEVRLKLETLQPTGSFKVRGAASKILSIDDDARNRGVVTASTGNHGKAVAHVAGRLGTPATVCVSELVPPGKVAALQAAGCRVVVGGDSQDAAMVTAAQLVESEALTLVHPFDDPEVIAGQGTIGLELAEQFDGLSHVLVPLSGGGLISGVAKAIKEVSSSVQVVGVSMVDGAAMVASLQAGAPIEMPEEPTLADSLQGGIGLENQYTFPMVRDLVDEAVLVSEDLIWDAMSWMFHNQGVVVEGAAAVGVAALLGGMIDPGASVGVVCSGSNIESDHLTALSQSRPRPGGQSSS